PPPVPVLLRSPQDSDKCCRGHEAGERQPDRELVVGVEEVGSDKSNEEATESAADRDSYVEGSQGSWVRFEPREFAMAHHACRKEGSSEERNDLPDTHATVKGPYPVGHKPEGGDKQRHEHRTVVQTRHFEANDEREQVHRERHDPQKWDGGHVLGEMV